MSEAIVGANAILRVRFYNRAGQAYSPNPAPTVRVLRYGNDGTTVELVAAGTATTADPLESAVFSYTVSGANNDRAGFLRAWFTTSDPTLTDYRELYNRYDICTTYVADPNSAAIQAAATAALTAYAAAKVSDLPAAAPNSAAIQAASLAALTAYDAATGSDISVGSSPWDLAQTGNTDVGTMGALIAAIYNKIQRGTVVVSGEQNLVGNTGTLTPTVKLWYAGATWKFDLKVAVNGVEQDIRGDTVTLSLTPQDGGTAILFTASIDTGLANGIAHFALSPASTITIPITNYFAEFLWIDGTDQNVLLRQNWEVLPRLTP